MPPMPLLALGATLGTAAALLALWGLFFTCYCLRRKRKGVSDQDWDGSGKEPEKTSVMQSSQQFSVEKSTESIQPKALLTFPNIYRPKLAMTSPEIVSFNGFSQSTDEEPPGPADRDTPGEKALKNQVKNMARLLPQNDRPKDIHIIETFDPDKLASRNDIPKLHFTLGYDTEKAELLVACIEAIGGNVEGGDESLCDYYVLGSLTTGTWKKEVQTALTKKTAHVVWNDVLRFPLAELEKPEGVLTLTLKNCDRFSRHNNAGEIKLSMANVGPAIGTGQWVDLKASEKVQDDADTPSIGEVLLSISYLPAASRLIVVLIKARDLPSSGLDDLHGKDMSVKVTLRHLSLKLKKKQTKRVKQKITPVWNEMIMFEVPHELLGASSVELEMLCQHSPGGPYNVLGRCRLGLQSEGTEKSHWQEMLSNPRRQIAMWHSLHP